MAGWRALRNGNATPVRAWRDLVADRNVLSTSRKVDSPDPPPADSDRNSPTTLAIEAVALALARGVRAWMTFGSTLPAAIICWIMALLDCMPARAWVTGPQPDASSWAMSPAAVS